MSNLPEVTDATFAAEVGKPGLTMVKFSAVWCGPCRVLAPVVDELAARYAGKVNSVSVNIDESPETTAACDIMGVPTIVFFKSGKEVGRLFGGGSKQAIEAEIKRLA
jgi:thioredoxin 1